MHRHCDQTGHWITASEPLHPYKHEAAVSRFTTLPCENIFPHVTNTVGPFAATPPLRYRG
jgi:hypothetical protein